MERRPRSLDFMSESFRGRLGEAEEEPRRELEELGEVRAWTQLLGSEDDRGAACGGHSGGSKGMRAERRVPPRARGRGRAQGHRGPGYHLKVSPLGARSS